MNWVDCANQQVATAHTAIHERIKHEALGEWQTPTGRAPFDGVGASAADERYYKWGGREPGRAWTEPRVAAQVLNTLRQALDAVKVWAASFDPDRVVLDYVTDVGSDVDKSNE